MMNTGSLNAIRTIDKLTHTGDFAGQPFKLRPWQRKIVGDLFKTDRHGVRVYRSCLLMLPRKNGKTELAAAIALYCLLFDSKQGEIYLAAADRDQAGKVFQAMVAMIRADPELDSRLEIVESQKRVVYRKTGSFCRAISSEAYSKHGFNASVVIYDELHCAPNRDLWDVLVTSQGGRLQPLMIAISTAGFDRHSILWELYSHAKNVIEDPSIDPTFLPIIFEAPQDADWTDEAVWKACNPALDDFRSIKEMRIFCQRAKAIPGLQNAFRRLYLNQWTEQDERWIDLATWDLCAGAVDLEALKGKPCYAGLDLASTRDVTAFVLVFPDDEGGFDIVPHFWVPKDTMHDRVTRDRVPYDEWARDGLLNTTEGNVCDYDTIRDAIRELAETFEIVSIAYDRWGATQLVTQLKNDGANVVPLGQGFSSLSAPSKELDKLIVGQAIRHGGHPVLRWMAGNVAIEQDAAGNVKPSKKKSTEKIDGIVALIMALDQATRATSSTSVYEADGAEVYTL
jgi:phage terminase large subunit-like protein